MASGDDVAVGVFYDRHGGRAYNLAFQMVGDEDVASEILCSAFRYLWIEASRSGPPSKPLNCLLHQVHARAAAHIRSTRGEQRAPADVPPPRWAPAGQQNAFSALGRLPELDRGTMLSRESRRDVEVVGDPFGRPR